MMKILIPSGATWNSFWYRFHDLCREFSRMGDEIIFLEPLVYKGSKEERTSILTKNEVPTGVKIVKRKTSLSSLFLVILWQNILNLHAFFKFKPDVILTYDSVFCFFLAVLSKFTGAKLVFDYIDDFGEIAKEKYQRLMYKYFFTPSLARLADYNITTAHALRDNIKRFNKRVSIAHNGVDLAGVLRLKLPKKEEDAILYIGGLGKWFDCDTLIESAKALPKISFKIFGTGISFNYLKEQSKKIPNLYVHGFIPKSQVYEEIAKAKICIMPFKINRLTDAVCPIKLMEYWALKKPVICPRTFELLKIAKGRVLFADNVKEFVEAVKKLMKYRKLRRKLGGAGFEAVKKDFDYAVIARDYHKILDDLLKKF